MEAIVSDKFDRLLTVRATASLLGIDQGAVRRLIRSGELGATRLSARRTRVRESELSAFVARHPLTVPPAVIMPIPTGAS